jgi:uncharacterized protein (UPF0333 family)
MDRRGQASAEYLLLIVVILLVMGWLLVNVYQPSVGATMDVSKTSDASNAVNSIADAANLVYANGPGSKRTLNVYIPSPGNIKAVNDINPKLIGMNLTYGDGSTKFVNASTDYNTTITTIAPTDPSDHWYKVTVEWLQNSKQISIIINGTA